MFDLKNTLKKIESVQGWIRPTERELLYKLASDTDTPSGCIVEIGSWKGKSTIILASASKYLNMGKVYAVDPFGPPNGIKYKKQYNLWDQQKEYDTFPDFINNIRNAQVDDYVIPIKNTSQESYKIWKLNPEPIRFLWIDGCHDREFAQIDFDLWAPHVVIGGYVAFHDSWTNNKDFNDSAAIVAKNEIINSDRFENKQCKSIIYGRKIK